MTADDQRLSQCADSTLAAYTGGVGEALERAADLASRRKSPATIAAYQSDVADWTAWAETHGIAVYPVDPGALAAYIGHLDRLGRALATIQRRCSAIAAWHRQHGHWSPAESDLVRSVLEGLAREHVGRKSPKRAFTADLVRNFVLNESTSPRDRALVAVAFVTGLRRSEIVALEWSDVTPCPDSAGYILRIRRSKADQTGAGAYVAVPRTFADVDPAALLDAWRELASGPRIFGIQANTVLRIAKRVATLAGLDPGPYGAHSFRAGMCTTAARAGVSLAESMQASRHASADVAASYVRDVDAGKNRAHRAAADALSGK